MKHKAFKNKCISFLLVFTFIIGIFSNLASSFLVAKADNSLIPYEYTGTESAEFDSLDSDFDGNYTKLCTYQVWSICKSLGMTDNQACAILGCFYPEGQCHPEPIEAHYGYGSDNYADIEEYIETVSRPYWEDTTAITKETLQIYGYPNYDPDSTVDTMIATAKTNSMHGNASVSMIYGYDSDGSAKTLNATAYFHNGVGYCGMGLSQFTGDRGRSLLAFCAMNFCDWWLMENQFTWMLTPTDKGGDSCSALWTTYVEETADMSVEDCTQWWIENYVNGNMGDSDRTVRVDYANAFYEKLEGKKWDSSWGSKVVSGAGLTPSTMHTGIIDKGIIQTYANATLHYPSNNGFMVDFETQKDLAEREEGDTSDVVDPSELSNLDYKNTLVYKGLLYELIGESDPNTTQYSLYELYGDDIHWYRYMGEKTYAPTLLDHIWCGIDQNKTDELLDNVFDTIDYEAPVYLSCNVYQNRPKVLTGNDIDNGYRDPRVGLTTTSFFNGYGYVVGTFEMGISKFFNSMIALLLSDKLLEYFKDAITTLEESEHWQNIMIPIIWLFIGFATICFIISLVKAAVNYAKGSGSAREAIERFLIGFMCMGFLLASTYNPSRTNDAMFKMITIVNGFFNTALTESSTIQNDEVIAVSDPDYVVSAVLWKNGIFNPWCRGQFDGLNYEELYTHYAILNDYPDSDNRSVMPQSNTVPNPADATNTPVYNSAETIGDVYVYVGGGKYIRNWAAFLYSCGSKYHIDATLNSDYANDLVGDVEDKGLVINNLSVIFPNANTTAYDSSLMADTFRVVDAQMDISPQYFPDGSISYNYVGAHKLKTHFMGQGMVMLFNTLLLAFFIPIIIAKYKNFIMLIILPIQVMWYTLLELFKPSNNIKELGDTFVKSLFGYFTACIKQNIMVLFYLIFVDKGIFMAIMYILLCLVLLGFNLQDARRFISDTKHNIQKVKNSF